MVASENKEQRSNLQCRQLYKLAGKITSTIEEQEDNQSSCKSHLPIFSTYLGVNKICQHTDKQNMTKDHY